MARIVHVPSPPSPTPVVGTHTPSDSYSNPTDGLNTVSMTMVWNPTTSQWERFGFGGIDDDFGGPRYPGVAIFGRPGTGLGETPQYAGVINNLADDADVFHSLAVAAYPRFRDAENFIRGRQSDSTLDALDSSTIGANSNFVFNGSTWDRVRGDTTYGMDVDVTRVNGTVSVQLDDFAAALRYVLETLQRPIWMDRGQAALRQTVVSGTLDTVTTVGTVNTVTTLNQLAGADAKQVMLDNYSKDTWLNKVRNRIT